MIKKSSALLSLTAILLSSNLLASANSFSSISFSELSGQANQENQKPVINFGETKKLDTKPQERVYLSEFTLSPQSKERHEKINTLIKQGKIVEAKAIAESFYNDVNEVKKGNVFLDTRSAIIEIEYLVALMDLAKIDMIMGDTEKAALKTQEMFSLVEILRTTHPIDFFLLSPVILDSMWKKGFIELADKYVSVVYPMCKTYFGGQAVCAELKIHSGLAKIIRWKKRDEGLIEIQEARDSYANQIGLASPEYIESLYSNALAYRYLNDYKSVEQVLDFAVSEAAVSVSKNYPLNPVFGKIYMLYGEVELHNFQNKKAVQSFKKAVDFYLQSTGKSLALAEAYRQLAIAQKYDKDFKEAANFAIKAIDIVADIYGSQSLDIVPYYMTLGGVYTDWDKPKDGIEAFQYARKINEKHNGSFHELNKLIDSNIKYLENLSSYRWKS